MIKILDVDLRTKRTCAVTFLPVLFVGCEFPIFEVFSLDQWSKQESLRVYSRKDSQVLKWYHGVSFSFNRLLQPLPATCNQI
jgi:hypothetical protein